MSDYEKKRPSQIVVNTRPRASSGDSVATRTSLKPPSLQSPRTARFAEATAVHSPIEPRGNHFMAQPQVSDVGFGYVNNKHESVEMPDTENNDYPPMKTPLKSAMKTPGAPPRDMGNMLSPTFKAEDQLEKQEGLTDKEQARDLKIKARVRIAKFFLRGINFSCALIIISMLSATFTIFNATKSLPPRNNLPPWAENQKIWPQVLLITIASIMLLVSFWVLYSYRFSHRRAEKVSVYYSAFALGFFVVSIVIWAVAAAALQGSRSNGDNKDMWGWSCVDNQRKRLFENEISYDLICRLQNWSLVCIIIEIVVETITIAVYGIVFYRFYSKRQLRKSMAQRDRARSDLYLAQLRSQSAPNTPGVPAGPLSPRDGGYKPSVHTYVNGPSADESDDVQYVDANQQSPPRAFQLQAPPIRVQTATPKMQSQGFTPMETSGRDRSRTPSPPVFEQDQRSPLMAEQPREQSHGHFDAAPGEQVYEAVPIPGAYQPMSPAHNAEFPR
ncbi:hypothetical protein Q7P37_002777 [Cladosporium fusiforme]